MGGEREEGVGVYLLVLWSSTEEGTTQQLIILFDCTGRIWSQQDNRHSKTGHGKTGHGKTGHSKLVTAKLVTARLVTAGFSSRQDSDDMIQ